MKRMTQDEYVRHIWNTQSTCGIRRRQKIIRWCFWIAGAIIGILFGLFLR